MVTSAAVPAVVGTAIIGTQGFFVGATPSKLLTYPPHFIGTGTAMTFPSVRKQASRKEKKQLLSFPFPAPPHFPSISVSRAG